MVLWFLVPMLDCARLIVSRLLQGKSPFVADRNHLHHLLSQRISSKKALLCYFALVGVPIALSIAVRALTPLLIVAEAVTYSVIVYRLTRRAEPAEVVAFQPASLGASVSRPAASHVRRRSVPQAPDDAGVAARACRRSDLGPSDERQHLVPAAALQRRIAARRPVPASPVI